jgi:hypothetical protein
MKQTTDASRVDGTIQQAVLRGDAVSCAFIVMSTEVETSLKEKERYEIPPLRSE